VAHKKKRHATKRKKAIAKKVSARTKKRAQKVVRKPRASKVSKQRRKKQPSPKSSSKHLEYTHADGSSFKVFRTQTKFNSSRYLTRKKWKRKLARSEAVVSDIKDRFAQFWKRNGKRGKLFFVRVPIVINVKGKRVKHGIAMPRFYIQSEKGLEKFLLGLGTRFEELLRKYSLRKDFKSISIASVSMEVLNEVPAKSAKKRSKK